MIGTAGPFLPRMRLSGAQRRMIQKRVRAGMARAAAKGTKSGKAIGRPAIPSATRTAIRHAYMAGDVGLRSVAQQFGVGVETVRRCLSEPARPFEHGAVVAPR